MVARILCIPDLHKRDRDSASIHGQMEAQRLVQEDLIAINKQYGITHNIMLGDWYHKGYHEIGKFWSDIELDRKISESVNGNVYLVIGNHFYLERDTNPEMYITQPNDIFTLNVKEHTIPDKPIFKVVKQLMIGTVQLDFFHFSKVDKLYVAPRNENTTCHIGFYHDDNIVPGWVREKEGYLQGSASQRLINQTLENIEIAVCGHIHTSCDPITIELANGKKVPMFIPGALSIVTNTEAHKHEFVNLPLFEIDDEYHVTIKQIRVPTHMECLRFSEKRSKSEFNPMQTVETLQSTFKNQNTTNLQMFLRDKGYANLGMRLVYEASVSSLSIDDVLRIITEEKVNEPDNTGTVQSETDQVY